MAIVYESIEVELIGSLYPSLNISIDDIQNASSRGSAYSKTCTLPSSKTINKYFNQIFEINTQTKTFNPNKKLLIDYQADGVNIIENGYLKLDAIILNSNKQLVEYQVTIFGRNSDLFSNIGEKELTDIEGLDTFNHIRNRTDIANSWNASIIEDGFVVPFGYGKGYVYPLINQGRNLPSEVWRVDQMAPAFYVKELFDRIFADAGKSYQSNFLSTVARFTQLIIPFNGIDLKKSFAQIENSTHKVDTVTTALDYITPKTLIFTNEVEDLGGVYNNTTGVFTCNDNGYYSFTSILDVNCTFTPSGNSVDVTLNRVPIVRVQIVKNGSVVVAQSVIYVGDTNVAIPPSTSYVTGNNVAYPSDAHYTNAVVNYVGQVGTLTGIDNKKLNPASNVRVNFQDLLLANGDTIEVKAFYSYVQLDTTSGGITSWFKDGVGGYYNSGVDMATAGAGSVNITSGKFISYVNNANLPDNAVVDMYQILPKNVKQKDFVKSIFNLFRLEIEPHPTIPNRYVIEPFDLFYTNDAVDWSEKLDYSKEIIIEPMALLQAKEYLFKYKQDKDYYNTLYENEFGEVYGQRSGLIDNDFVKDLEVIELIFSPTPLVQVPDKDLILPTILNQAGNGATESNIRILLYSGLKPTATPFGIQSDVIGGTLYYNSYPFSGHVDDPYNANFDLNFGLPKKIYWNNQYNGITLTNNNAFNVYHLNYLQQIAQQDSKLAAAYFYLKPTDINKLSFRKLYFFENAYFRHKKIEGYNPSNEITKCSFLKVVNQSSFTATPIVLNGGNEDIVEDLAGGISINEGVPSFGGGEFVEATNYTSKSATNTTIQGDGNLIGSNTKNIQLINCTNCIVEAGIENVTLINCNGITISESNKVYINNSLF